MKKDCLLEKKPRGFFGNLDSPVFGRKLFVVALFLVAGTSLSTSLQAQITGTVFRDYNGDGVKQAGEPAREGIIVKAYRNATLPATDALLTQTTTDINGNYTLNPAAYPVRLEFSIPTGLCNLDPSQDFPAPNGDTYGSAIQFASGPGTHNFIINYPSDFSVDPDPQVFTSCFVNGDPLAGGSAGEMDGFVRFNYLDNGHGANSGYGNPGANGGPYGPPHDLVAVAKQLGSTWGVAYSRQAKKLFTPAFMKRHAGMGPLGPGGIYMIDANTFSPAANYNWLDFDATLNIATHDEGGVFTANPMDGFNNVFFEPTVGSNPARGLSANMQDPSRDAAAWEQVGKVAFGDIDITEDGQFVYVVNLYDRKLYSIDVTDPYNPIAPTLADVGTKVKSFSIPNPCSPNPQAGEMRPFALKIARGKVYVGLICSAQNQNGDIVGTQNDMTAFVYTFDIATQTWDPAPVLQFPLNYRESTANRWRPWTSQWVNCFECEGFPMLADIEFDGEGNMILGIMDRRGHQAGWYNMDLEGISQENIAAVGDMLRAVRDPNQPTCEYSISFDPEFYKDDKFHVEPTQGGLAVHRTSDFDNILAAYMDPVWIWSGGVMRFDNKTGNQLGDGYEIYYNVAGGASGPFGKAHGIGDLEVVEEEPPIEVGNRVWVDIDRDGIQDADEPGLANVDVQLKWPDGTVLATVQTDGDGDFFFFLNNVPDGDPTQPGLQKGLQPYTDYKICVPATEFNNGQPLNNFLVTKTNATGVGAVDQADNDGVLLAGGDVQIMFTTTARGENNHNLDFGFAATDYGDLPNSYGTTDGSNGPWHWINPNLMLGSCVDSEMDGQPQSMAGQMTGGDDNSLGSFVAGTCAGNSDDENGIIFSSPMIPGSQACITVNAINNTGASAVLQAWIDWNGNGIFEATDQVASGHFSPVGATVPIGGLTNAVLCFDVPANASFMNGAAFTRFRLSPTGGLTSGGGGADGEVEDYKLTLAKVGTLVWYDQNNDGIQNEPTSAGINGTSVNLTWLGPDAAVGGGDDVQYTTTTSTMGGVNGTYMFLGLTPGMYKIVPGAPVGYLAGQEDLGGNDFKDGDAHAGVMVVINDPISLVTAENGTGDIPGGTNGFPDAQDDLSFDFNYVTADYGDLPAPYATASGSNGPSHIIVTGLRIGATVDGEPNGQPSINAFGDGNDENGVSFPIMYIGLPANITVNMLNTTGAPATLYGFIDWNKDGVFTGPNESLTLAVPDGTNGDLVLPFVVPAGAVAGMDLGARFRLSNAAGLTANGPAPSGEVEDYLIQICDVVAVLVSQVNVSCNGGNDGSVDLTVTNGNAPFTYDWSNDGPEAPDDDIADVTGLSAGTYTVTVTDNNGCTSTTEVTITEPSVLTNAISNIDDANCLGNEDGSATATANGGVSPYDYAWSYGFTQLNVASSNATGLGAGGYNVTVTDVNGCTVITGFEIADPTGVTLVVNAPITNETCDESNNGLASVTASGGTPPFTFNWTGGTIVTNSPSSTASNLQAGTYLVTATDANGCWAIQTIVITQPTDLVAQIVGKLDAGCAGVNDGSATVTATGGITPYTYDWSNDGPENPDNDLATATGLAAGTYTVTVTDANGCTATTSVTIGTVAPLALTLSQDNENQCGHADGSIDLTVSGGTPAYTYDWSIDGAENPDNDQDDLTGLAAGTYTVTVTDARGCSAEASVIITCTIPASIGNYTWIDTNADGIQDPTESPLPGVVVILSGTDNNGNDVNAVQATDGNGLYLFDDLFPGTYKLTFVTPVGGYIPTTPNAPLSNDANDSDAVPGMGGMTAFEVLTAGEDNRDYDAGYYIPASIGDYAWVDDNANGVQDSGEPGLEGVIVMLTGTDALGNAVMLMATTDVSGYYIFADLVPGTYKLKFTAPTGTPYEMTGNDLGGDDAMDSDANESMGGMTVNETLVSGEHNPTYDAGFYIPASLGNYVWIDENANGVQEAGESTFPGVTVKLQDALGNAVTVDADGNTINNQVTDSDGFYQFANLIPGTYKVMFVNPNATKYTLTVPNAGTDDAQDSDPTAAMLMTQTTTLGSGDNDPTLDAGFYSKAKVGNFVWHDLDADGIQDPMEPGINNVTVTLTGTDNLGNPVSLTTSTTGNGMYMFGDLVPGSYKITFGTPAGYTPTDADQGTNDALDSDFGPMGMTPVFTVESSDTILTFDAGFYLPAQIGNYTWIDANADGDQDGTESPLPGVLVVLTGTTGSGEPVNLTATTDANGLYLFSNLQPGTYKLTFQTPFGNYISTTANDVNATESTDSDADPTMGGMSINEVLTSGESNLTYDAGYYALASIGDFVWHDLDGDGVQDGGEPGIGGVTVTLTGTDGQGNPVTLTTTTAPDGSYLFPDLVPGTYKLTFTTPAGGYVSSDVNEGGNDANDSDADPSMGGMTANEILTSGEHNPTYDAGYYLPAEIGNYTWIDANANGIQDMGEAPISGVPVTLTGTTASGDAVTLNDVTDGNGLYLFTGLEPGTYKLTFGTPAGYVVTLANDPDDATDALDSDANPAMGGMTTNEILTSGESNLTYDAGYYALASIGNYTWIDTNADGIQDPTESPLPGVTVTLTGTDGQGNPVSLTDVTDGNGLYLFENLVPGTYKLTFTTPAGGYVPTDANQGGNDAADSDADPLMGGMTVLEVLTSGENNLTYDAGYYLPAEIGNYTWIDANADGDQDGTESPLPGVLVILNGTTGSGESVNLTTTTDANGLYLFNNLQPGTYKLTFQTPFGNYISTTANDVNASEATDSDADPANGGMSILEVLTSGESNLTYDAGYYELATIGNFVWNDANANGIQEVGEDGIPNVTVTLTGTDGQGNAVTLTTTTDGNGLYLFPDLVPGTYKLTFGTPAGFDFTSPLDLGGNDALDSDANPANANMTVNEILTSGEVNLTYDAGFYQCPDISILGLPLNPVCPGAEVGPITLKAEPNATSISWAGGAAIGLANGTGNGPWVEIPAFITTAEGAPIITVTAVLGQCNITETFVINVEDSTPPVLQNCPSNLTVGNDVDKCGSNVVWTAPTAIDNCDNNVALTQTSTPPGFGPGSLFPVGVTTITYEANDGNGNTVSCSFTITVTDMQAPNAVCKDITVNLSSTTNGGTVIATATQVNGGSTDNCTPAANLILAPASTTYTCANLGDNVITLTVTDAAGNTSTCAATVTVRDVTAPLITCPADLSAVCSENEQPVYATLTAFTNAGGSSSDNCGVTDFILESEIDNGLTCPKTVTRVYRISDASGNTATCAQNVVVNDLVLPSLNCPGPLTAICSVNEQPIYDNLNEFTAAGGNSGDNCGVNAGSFGMISQTQLANVYTRTYRISDNCGNSTTCAQTVTVLDVIPPVFSNCPANITVGNDVDKCGSNVFWTAPSATDNCVTVTVAQTVGLAPGALFPVGTTTVTYVATDATGNTVSCNFTITVTDMQAPNTVCKDITVNLSSTTNAGTVTVTAAQVNGGSTDNCTPAANLVLAPASTNYTCANVGDNLITLTVTDAVGNTSTCAATVTVVDASAPVITTCPANVTVNDCDDVVPAMTNQLVATDNCGVASVTQNPVAGTDFGQVSGNTVTVTFTVTDVNGNVTTCTNTITILDNVNPAFTNCPANITVGNDVDKCGANVTFLNPTAVDNCSGVTVAQTVGLATGALFPVGTTTQTYVATDASGNTVSCNFTVTVTDMQAPNAVCKDITVNLSSTTNAGAVTVTAAQVNGGSTDNCTPAANLVLAPASTNYTCANVGDNLITLTVTDAVGNTSTCVATVTVVDASAPVITTCPANVTVNDCDDVVPAMTNQLIATDNCGVASVTQNPVAGTDFGQVSGNAVTVTFTVTDVNGNVTTCTNTITIVDNINPAFTNCPANITVGNDVEKCGANVFWTAPSASDNCSGVTVAQTLGLAPGALYPVGTTAVRYVATDASGNTISCNFTVTVTDMQAPNAVCQDITVNLSSTTNAGAVTVTAAQVNGGSTDNCTPAANLVLAPASTNYTCANVGDNLITLTVTDAVGNTSTCVATVTVRDVTPPVFTCPAPVTVPSCTSTVPNVINGLTATDNCGVASITQNPVAGSDFGQVNGNTVIVTVTVTDVNGNVSTCDVVVTIIDAGPPVFVNCPTSMIMIGNDPDQCNGKVNWPIPVALDECLPLANVVQTAGPIPGSVVAITCPPTPTNITYKATDGAGNMSFCNFQIMVIDTEKPEFDADILMPGNVTVECDAVPTNCIPRTGGACTPLTVSDVNDNCAGPLTVNFNEVSTQDPNPANCGHYNYTLTRTWTITDCADNALIAAGLAPTHALIHIQVITVRDTKAPTALCKNATVQLDKTGKYILDPQTVNNGSFDNCAAFANLAFSVSPNQFTCANLGPNLVTLSVTDPCGNVGTCQATVTVEEGIAPCTPQMDVETICMGNSGNATTLDNGQFQDIITIKSLAMQTWTLTVNSSSNGKGAYSISSPAPPASPVALPIGTLFTAGTSDGIDNDGDGATDEADEMIYYTLKVVHVECKGYDITVSNAGGIGLGLSATTTRIENKACYPNPYFTNLLEDVYCLGTPAFTIAVGEYANAAGSVVPGSVMVDGVPTTVFDASALGLGAHTVMATFDAGTATQNLVINGIQVGGTMQDAINDPGCKQKITKVVNIVETPTTLICNDLVYVSMDEDCKVTVNADEVLEGTYFCYDDYTVEVDKTVPMGNGPWVMAMFDASDIGKTYQYHVIHSTGGQNLCWGQIKIEDKLAPALTCPADLTIACSESTDVSNTGNVIAKDCSTFTRVIDDEYQDFGECASPRAQIVRTWIVTDTWGNQAACSQTITITPFDLDDVVFPAEAVVNCESAYNNANAISPDVTGRPSINGAPIGSGGYCSASVGYTDVRLEICAGSFEILRTWTVRNTCLPLSNSNPATHTQIIQVKDFGGPQFVCPPAVTVSTDPLNCCATAALPDMIVSEGCSNIIGLEAKVTGNNPNNGNVITFTVPGYLADFAGNNYWNPDTLAVFNYTQCLPVGEYNVRYKASDECGNTSYCNFKLTVADLVPPVAACDQFTQVSIGADSSAFINAATFNDGSYDNCAPVEFKVRRMLPNDCQTDTLFHDQAKFCCTDIGDTIMVVFRVYDLDIPSGDLKLDTFAQHHYNDCMVSVLVEDKIKPTCAAPAQVAVNCENFDPSLWTYGFATGVDNCCLDTITTTTNYALFDTVCNKGTITRTFRSSDCAGNTSSCTQRVIVTYEQDYFVKFPNDVIVTVCDGTGNYGDPIFFGEDCELLGVTYADEIFTVVPDACFEIQRTWQIINWCTFNPNLPFIDVPNPTPNAISNAPQNLPGPTVSACGTLPPWKSTIVKINPSDPLPGTDYCTFWDKNANGYRYKQIIKITDTQAPTGTYTTPTCDNQNWNTANNNALWNEMHWWDNGLQIHDLCEEPTDLCITGTDACSGSNVNIEYLLFLDLDNDGTMETVVNSVNTGLAGLGWNNVQYGNASNPNFGGGTARTFDTRPVPSNLKYGFTIQETVVGTNKTACVRWNTQQQQNTYVTPELPNGTHKIKWFITDGCGNNKEYEYSFTVKDCKAPTVVCLNGLSTNIMPTGMIKLWANDFLQYTEDNCTPAAQIKTGIRKCGTGTGFPLDAQGNPITNVTFTCTELGTQCVELWAIDAAGNADYCETYVIVQDNNGNCATGDHINVAGAVKTEMTDGVEETTVNISGTSTFAPPFAYFDLSNADGTYAVMNNVPLASTFVIAPEKDDNPLNGVTTYDLVLISKHILGTEPFDSPFKMIAADANKSGSITTFDVVELRKLILGIYTELPNNTSWRFVDKSFVFPNMNNPFQTQFPETISVADALSNQVGEDFAGVKVGDVNNTVVANATMQAEERTQGTTIFDLEDRQVKPGEEFEVNFKAAEELKGFQFTMLLDGLKAIGTVNAEHVNEGNFNLTPENAMAVSIDGAQDFTVKFRAEKAGKLSNMLGVSGSITRAEAYGKEGRKNIAFRYDGNTIAGVGFELYQNQPNPFVNKTSIGFFLPEMAEATLSIFDETGRMVYQQKGQFAKGENMIALDRSLLNTTGVLYYKLETATDSATRKMIQAK